MFGLVSWSALWIVLLCMWLTQRNESKFKKNFVLGVTFPFEAHVDPQVQQILKQYQKNLDRVCLLLGAVSIAGGFIPDMSISLICWSGMLILDLVLPMWVFARSHGKLKALKKERGWMPSAKQQVRVDVSAMITYPRPKWIWYLLAAALCVIPLVFQRELRWVHILSAATAAMSGILSVFCYRRKSETVDENQELTRTLSQLRYRMWNRIWTASACCAVFISYSIWAMEISAGVGISLVVLTVIAFSGAVMALEMHTRKLQETLTAQSGQEWYIDEDDHWLWGQFYYNPNDSHMMVNARVGAGTTINLASTGGKVITGFVLASLVGTMVFLAFLGIADKSEILLDTTAETVFCENGSTRYEVPFEEIEQLELLTEMPDDLLRTGAIGGQHLFKGSFAGKGMSDLRILADLTNPPYLKIKITSGQYYLFGARDPQAAEKLYSDLSSLVREAQK